MNLAFKALFPGQNNIIVAVGRKSSGGQSKVIKGEIDKNSNDLTLQVYNPQDSTHSFQVFGAVELSGDYYALVRKVSAGNVYGVMKLSNGNAKLFSNLELSSISISGTSLLLSGALASPYRALFSLMNPGNLTPIRTYAYSSPTSTFGLNAMPYSTGHVLVWSGSAFVGFSDSGLDITGFPNWSSVSLIVYDPNYTFSSSPPSTSSHDWRALNWQTTPQSLVSADYPVTVNNIYTYTPPSGGGGGGGPIVILPPQPEPETPPSPPPPPPPPAENPAVREVIGTTITGESVTIRGEVPRNEARITSASYTPPEECPTPSVFKPQYGGVRYSIDRPLTDRFAGSLSLRQNRSSTTLTITYSRPLDPKAKVFACTSMGCMDITNLATIDVSKNSVTLRVEDGGALDEDGQVNGRINTKNFVYAVVPESYAKSGGCAVGTGTDYGLTALLLVPLLLLARRVQLRLLLLLTFLSFPALASTGQLEHHIREGEYEEALSILDSLIKERGLSEERVLLKSYLLLRVGQLKEAVSFVEESLKFIPSDKLRLRLAYLYGLSEDFSKGWQVLRQVKKKDQDYHFVEGVLHFKRGSFTKAKHSLSKVTPSSENYQEAQLYLAQVFLLEEDAHRLNKAVAGVRKDSEFYENIREIQKEFRERKRLNFNLALGAEYDTNLLGVFDLETKIRTWKYFTALRATYRGDAVRGSARAYLSYNEKGSSFNLNLYSLELEPVLGNFSAPLRFEYVTLGGDFYANIGQIGLSYRSLYGAPYLLVGYQDYLGQAFEFENRDGYFVTAGYRYEHIAGNFYGNLNFYVKNTDTKGVNWDSTSGGARLFGSYSVGRRFSTGVNLGLEGNYYRNQNQAFLKRRRDTLVSVTPFFSFNLYRNFNLLLSYTYARNFSSINYYTYTRNLYTLQLTSRF
ncbi:MAG: choice-of-anchor U domain-containing protein [Aquificaceae bacterium]|nr:choice-of-anchor U domain-containing protein [Aquificaceae bacterium]